MMLQQDEHEQELKVEGGHDKEIDRDELLGVVLHECPPRLGRGLAVSDHVLGDSSFRNLNPQFQQRSMNPRRTPNRIRHAHLTDQIANCGGDFRSARTAFARPFPVQPKSLPMLGDHGFRFDDHEGAAPVGPNFRKPRTKQPIRWTKLHPPLLLSAQNIQLVAQSEILQPQGQLGMEQRTK